MDRLTDRNNAGNAVCRSEYADDCNGKCSDCDYDYDCFKRLAEYEDIGATPDELKTAVYLYLELSQKMRKIVKDMKWYLDENEEDGVVYIPKFVIEEIAYGK